MHKQRVPGLSLGGGAGDKARSAADYWVFRVKIHFHYTAFLSVLWNIIVFESDTLLSDMLLSLHAQFHAPKCSLMCYFSACPQQTNCQHIYYHVMGGHSQIWIQIGWCLLEYRLELHGTFICGYIWWRWQKFVEKQVVPWPECSV